MKHYTVKVTRVAIMNIEADSETEAVLKAYNGHMNQNACSVNAEVMD